MHVSNSSKIPARLISAGDWAVYEPSAELRFFDVRSMHDEILEESIPGARAFTVESLEGGPFWNHLPLMEIQAVLLNHGITADSQVVLSGANTIMVARVAHLMLYAGVKDVGMIDGGIPAWKAAGFRLSSTSEPPYKSAFVFGSGGRPEFMVDLEGALALLGDPSKGRLVSIRSWAEHNGETSGYSHIAEKGDIPRAVWGRGGSDADHMEDYRNLDNTMAEPSKIEAYWLSAGLRREDHLCFYCGTGWRASEVFFYALVLGWRNVSVFDGGWKEYSARVQLNDSSVPEECIRSAVTR